MRIGIYFLRNSRPFVNSYFYWPNKTIPSPLFSSYLPNQNFHTSIPSLMVNRQDSERNDRHDAADPNFKLFEPGLLQIKNALTMDEQIALSNMALQRGEEGKQGFWRKDTYGNKTLNSTDYRGRFFTSVEEFPKVVSTICKRTLSLAYQTDKSLNLIEPTHVIALYYKTLAQTPPNGYIPWHQDNGDNDGDAHYPVISFNIGDSCDFLIAHQKPRISSSHHFANPKNLAHRILFESGDILLFGGPCRYVWHAIYTIHPNTAPSYLSFKDARLNFTFRHTPSLIGDEKRFETKPAAELEKDNQFYRLSKMR